MQHKLPTCPRQRLISAQTRVIDRLVAIDAVQRSGSRMLNNSTVTEVARNVSYRTADGLIHLAKFRALMLTRRVRRASARPWESDIRDVDAECASLKQRAARELALALGCLEAAETALAPLFRPAGGAEIIPLSAREDRRAGLRASPAATSTPSQVDVYDFAHQVAAGVH